MRSARVVRQAALFTVFALVVLLALSLGQVSAHAAAQWPARCAYAHLRFTGNGSRDIAPIRVRRNSTLYWRAAGNYFFVANRFSSPDLNVISTGAHGTTYMRAGRYQLAVGAVGAWKICILPG